MSKNKIKHLFIVFAIYVLAFAIGVISSLWINNVYLRVFFADVIATIVIWIFTLIFKNSSIYDPYWSVTPILISTYLFIYFNNYSIQNIILFIVFNLWAIRLTVNWIIVFTDFTYEDWRYKKFREENKPIVWHLINFSGIQMFPTLLVFGGILPMFVVFQYESNWLSLIGVLIIAFGILLEFISDHQMHDFLKNTKEKVTCKNGLWKYSRHPNYLGELSIWVGLMIAMLLTTLDYWYFAFGVVLLILLFEFISIPLMEKRQMKRRSDYAEYKKVTSRLFILPNRKLK